ncbi:MAG: hypothetical protein ACXACK_00040 [Candidatus Hodarchaeales archaeon]|jgi:hypothetical protein
MLKKIKSFKLTVNDRRIGAKRFVQEFIGNSLAGMVETLRLKDSTIHKINIEIKFIEKSSSE